MIIKCTICKKTVEYSQNLSKKQIKVLKFIQDYQQKNNKTPSFREIAKGLNYQTPSNVFRMIDTLIDKQYIQKRPYSARSFVILKALPCA